MSFQHSIVDLSSPLSPPLPSQCIGDGLKQRSQNAKLLFVSFLTGIGNSTPF